MQHYPRKSRLVFARSFVCRTRRTGQEKSPAILCMQFQRFFQLSQYFFDRTLHTPAFGAIFFIFFSLIPLSVLDVVFAILYEANILLGIILLFHGLAHFRSAHVSSSRLSNLGRRSAEKLRRAERRRRTLAVRLARR